LRLGAENRHGNCGYTRENDCNAHVYPPVQPPNIIRQRLGECKRTQRQSAWSLLFCDRLALNFVMVRFERIGNARRFVKFGLYSFTCVQEDCPISRPGRYIWNA
jgi:hypothetical protein